jgi:serine O-acetyltransferase
VNPPIKTRGQLASYLTADLQAYGLDRWRLRYRFSKPTLHYQRLLRRVERGYANRGPYWRAVTIVRRFRLAVLSQRLGLSVPPGVFGPGLSLPHYGSVVVNSDARVGSYCRLHSATNIGTAGGAAPRLGDFVYIGPGAVLYGNISVGSRAVIGANSVVNKDVAPGVTVGGAPARVVRSSGSESVMPLWIRKVMTPLDATDSVS